MTSTRSCKTALLLLLLASGSAVASEGSSSTEAPKTKRLGLTTIIETFSSLHQLDDPNRSAGSRLWLMPAYSLTETLKLSFVSVINQDWTGAREASLIKSSVAIRHKGIPLNPFLNLSLGGSMGLPLTAGARSRSSLITSMNATPRLRVSFAPLGLDSLSAEYELSGTRLIHEYTTSTTGKSNTMLDLSQTLNLSYALIGPFSISTSFNRGTSWTYEGNASQRFDFGQELGYEFSSALALAVGHSNSGSALKPNGVESNIAFFDGESSSVYGSMALIF